MNKDFWALVQKYWRRTIDEREIFEIEEYIGNMVDLSVKTEIVNPYNKNPLLDWNGEDDEED